MINMQSIRENINTLPNHMEFTDYRGQKLNILEKNHYLK